METTWTARRRSAGRMLVLAAGLFVVLSCGGKKRPPPPLPQAAPPSASSSPAPAADQPAPRPVRPLSRIGEAPAVRVLLKERFKSVLVEGSTTAPSLKAEEAGGRIRIRGGRVNEIRSGFRLEAPPGKLIRVDGKPYRGAVEVFINPLGRAVAVNEVDMEDYLRGVLSNEISPRAHPEPEAFKAQAVAARSYAGAELGKYASRGFDVYGDHRSQVYGGSSSEHSVSNRAVQATRGVLALFNGSPIIAFYSSTCGGKTESYEAVYGGRKIKYLEGGVSCPDESSPYHRWNDTVRVDQIQSTLDRFAGVGRLKEIKPVRRSPNGRVQQMRFEGSRGKKVVRGLSIRSALGLKSHWITDLDVRRDRSGFIVEIRARGRGFGHGVGLCQIGSVELASRGWRYEKILKHYYRGIDLKQRW